MVVDEEMLAKYRKQPKEEIALRSLPKEWFSDSQEVFGQEWRAIDDGPPSAVTLVLAFTRLVPPLHPDRTWQALWHQSGGGSTNATLMIATALTPRPDVKAILDEIAVKFYYAETGHFDRFQMNVSLLVEYVRELSRSDIDCEASWRLLEEAIYPIDATQPNLERVCLDAPDLSQITRWGNRVPRYIDNPTILLLTENSD